MISKMGEDWAEFKVRPGQYHDAGSVVTVEGRYAATHNGAGTDMDCQFCHVWTVDGGKITKFQQYTDTAKMRDVMGAAGAAS